MTTNLLKFLARYLIVPWLVGEGKWGSLGQFHTQTFLSVFRREPLRVVDFVVPDPLIIEAFIFDIQFSLYAQTMIKLGHN